MTRIDFLGLLNGIDFPRRYWELCDQFPLQPIAHTKSGRKEDVLNAFASVGVKPKYRQRSFEFEEESIGDFLWSGVFVKQRNGVELMIGGKSKNARIGDNFAVLAYDTKRLANPTFQRNPFNGPPPYPRPHHNGNPDALHEIVVQHIALVRLIKDALRSRSK